MAKGLTAKQIGACSRRRIREQASGLRSKTVSLSQSMEFRLHMRWIKIFLIVVGSNWFFPASCSTGVILGAQIVAALDRRDVLKGDRLHSLFKVAAEPGESGQSFRALSYPVKEDSNVSFRMSGTSASFEKGGSAFSYRVIEDSGQEQLIELVETYKDGDNQIWSRYKATETEITPLSSRMFYFGYMFTAFPFAVVCALFLAFSARIVRRIYLDSKDVQKDS